MLTGAASAMYLVLVVFVGEEANAFGMVDYNDECEFIDLADPATFVSRLEEWKYCDTNRGLQCAPGVGRCGCVVPFTIYRGGKCRARVNSGCIIKDYKLECVENAVCTRNASSLTFRCRCDRGYLSNAENTACFSRHEFDYRRRNYRYRDGYGYNGYGDGYYWGAGGKCAPINPAVQFSLTILAVIVLFLARFDLS